MASLYNFLTNERPEYKQDTPYDPGLNGCQTLSLGDVCSDCIKNVDQDQEDCNQKRHPEKVLFKLSNTSLNLNILKSDLSNSKCAFKNMDEKIKLFY